MKNRAEGVVRQELLFPEVEIQSADGLYAHERYWKAQGYGIIAGTDEAGRGPLAGPVVAAAVILPELLVIPGLNDSKKLSARRRELLYDEIVDKAVAVAWSSVGPATIDRINIYAASRLAMVQAIASLDRHFDLVLSDAMPLPDLVAPCIPIIHGDALSASIAAASIIAKVTRDRIMGEMDRQYPQYGFGRHKGYGTVEHLTALKKYGPCSIHRQSFAPIKTWRFSAGED